MVFGRFVAALFLDGTVVIYVGVVVHRKRFKLRKVTKPMQGIRRRQDVIRDVVRCVTRSARSACLCRTNRARSVSYIMPIDWWSRHASFTPGWSSAAGGSQLATRPRGEWKRDE